MKACITHRRAHFDFELLNTYEAGLELFGLEVKAIRRGLGKIEGAHVIVRGGEAYLVGASIPAYQPANAPGNYDPERARRLLLSRKEIGELTQRGAQKGLTIVPLMLYSTGRNIKLKLAVARGKKRRDKRQSLKERDTKRDIERTLKAQKQSPVIR